MRTTASLREALDEIEQIDVDALSGDEVDSLLADLRELRTGLRAEGERLDAELAGRCSR